MSETPTAPITDPDYETPAETLDEAAEEDARRSLRVVALQHASNFSNPTDSDLTKFLENAEKIERYLLGKKWRDKEV